MNEPPYAILWEAPNVPGESLTACALWDLEGPEIPPRSRLYPLEPVGLGTSDVESLSSYVTRLAQAHCVDPYVLMTREIKPHIGERRLVWHWAMNGTRTVARRWVEALEALTQRRGLAELTFLPWARVLDAVPLLRRERAWCPACYHTWRAAGTPVYEPLLWMMRDVTACPTHHEPLREQCPLPTCRAWSRVLGRRVRPGYCQVCQRWLGYGPDGMGCVSVECPATVTEADRDLAWAVGALIATSAAGPGLVRLDRKGPLARTAELVTLARRWNLRQVREG